MRFRLTATFYDEEEGAVEITVSRHGTRKGAEEAFTQSKLITDRDRVSWLAVCDDHLGCEWLSWDAYRDQTYLGPTD